jgi:hypothetical protein
LWYVRVLPEESFNRSHFCIVVHKAIIGSGTQGQFLFDVISILAMRRCCEELSKKCMC